MPDDELDPDLEALFPKLRPGLYRVTSPKDPRYNCFAFAANDTQHYWQYMGPGKHGGYFWPKEIKGDSLEDVISVYALLGFQVCETSDLEPDVVKIAIYVDDDSIPSHVARQTRKGVWKSKLGRGKDIEHASLHLLEGNERHEYGWVAAVMKKRRYDSEDVD
jgi:hypothetical protein